MTREVVDPEDDEPGTDEGTEVEFEVDDDEVVEVPCRYCSPEDGPRRQPISPIIGVAIGVACVNIWLLRRQGVDGIGRMTSKSMAALRKFALQLPGAEEGVACKGTSLEARTFKIGKKAFLFLRQKDARLKLKASLKDAAKRASREPDRYVVGANGWVLLKFDDATDPIDVLTRWVAESHSLFAKS